jgi:hypothetical protein
MSWSEFNVRWLKKFLKERGLNVTGSAAELAERLEDHDINELLQKDYERWTNEELVQVLLLRDLKSTGTRDELIDRMQRFDDDDEELRDFEDDSEGNDSDWTDPKKKIFAKGTQFRNVLATSKDRVGKRAKEIIKSLGRTNCAFCWKGKSTGLNHVVLTSEKNVSSDEYYLAPGCAKCNKRFDVLILKAPTVVILPPHRKVMKQVHYYVMQHE